MNQRKKGKKNYKCDACFKIFPSLKDYQKHVSQNIECKKNYRIVANFVIILDTSHTDSKNTYNANQPVINFIKKKKLPLVR